MTVDLGLDTTTRFLATEYSSLTGAGAPITWPVTPYRGQRSTIDVSTGITYPLKAERARRDPRVALSFTLPTGSGLDDAPIIAVQGLATVRDRDLVATSSRYLRASSERFPDLYATMPTWLLRRLDWCWTRAWIEVTPTRVLWWHGGDLSTVPQEWNAPTGTDAPPSDPPPTGRSAGSWNTAPTDWRRRTAGVIDRFPPPVLTTIDHGGFPLPLKARSVRSTPDGFAVVPPVGVEVRPGRAFLSFHTHADRLASQENIGLTGTATVHQLANGHTEVQIHVDRALADFGVPRGQVRNAVQLIRTGRRLRPRLEVEAARRSTVAPTYDQLTVATADDV